MQTEEFIIQNVKCGGCVSTVQEGLKGLPGISEVEVVIDGGKLTVRGDGFSREEIVTKLAELGYPEA